MSVEQRIFERQQARAPLQKWVDLQTGRVSSTLTAVLFGIKPISRPPEHTAEVSVHMITSAKEKVVVVATRSFHPWLFPSQSILQALDGVLKKGVDVSVVFGPEQDNKHLTTFQKLGGKLKLYKSPEVSELNYMVIDNRHLVFETEPCDDMFEYIFSVSNVGLATTTGYTKMFNQLLQAAQPL